MLGKYTKMSSNLIPALQAITVCSFWKTQPLNESEKLKTNPEHLTE